MFRNRKKCYCMNNNYSNQSCELQNEIMENQCNEIRNYEDYMDQCSCGFDEETNLFPENPMLAQSYVPIQYMDRTFRPCVGLKMGTIFPELVSPYMPGQSMEEIRFIESMNKIGEGAMIMSLEDRNCNCMQNNNMNNMMTHMGTAQGMNNMNCPQREEMLQEIRCYDFAINELALYLDTHVDDEKALCLHRKYTNKVKDLKDKYQRVYGPLTIYFPCNKWRWIEEPWPWERGNL